MMSGTLLELYAAARQRELPELRTRQAPPRQRRRPLWTQWLARALVRAAAGLSSAQVRIEWPVRA